MKKYLVLFSLLALFPVLTYGQANKLFYPACQAFSSDAPFDCYRNYEEMTQFLQDAASQHPDHARLSSLGQSYEGRELWLLTVTDFTSGPPESKPALWVDGGVDSDEVISTEAALGLIHRLLRDEGQDIQDLLNTTTFYIAPNVIPDMSEVHHATPIRPRDSTMKPWDDDGDGQMDEDPPEDLDGDNQALQMRVVDPDGGWVKSEEDDRYMRRRKMGDTGPFYALYSEGIDNDGDGAYNEDWPGGIDPNRNYPGNWSANQNGSGPYPGSEVEVRAMLDFIYDHPNIAASQHFHSSGGVILRPPSVPDMNMPASDRALFLALSEEGLKVTGYPLATSVYDWNWPRGSKNTKRGQLWQNQEGQIMGVEAAATGGNYSESPLSDSYGQIDPYLEDHYAAYGGSIDGVYLLFGILGFANEIYTFGEDTDGDGSISTLEQLAYQDNEMDGVVFKNWTPYNHPDLGPVEIGGMKKFGANNPIGDDIAEEVRRNVEFVLLQAHAMPALDIADHEVTAVDDGIYRVTATIRNNGFQPTELAVRENLGRAMPVAATITLSTEAILLDEKETRHLGIIGGNRSKEVSWLVKATSGAQAIIEAEHPKGGRSSITITF